MTVAVHNATRLSSDYGYFIGIYVLLKIKINVEVTIDTAIS